MSTLTWIPRKFKLLFNWNFPATLTLINFLQVESLHGWKCRRSNFISAVIAFPAWIHFIIERSFLRKSFHLFVTHSQPANARKTVGVLAVSGFFSLSRSRSDLEFPSNPMLWICVCVWVNKKFAQRIWAEQAYEIAPGKSGFMMMKHLQTSVAGSRDFPLNAN